jgi:hypothetical protein
MKEIFLWFAFLAATQLQWMNALHERGERDIHGYC